MTKYLGILLAVIISFTACQGNASYQAEATKASFDQNEMGRAERYEESTGDEEQAPAPDDKLEIARKVIKTIDTKFQVKDLAASTKKIEALAAKYQALVTQMNQRNTSYSINNTLTIRVPAEEMDAFLLAIKKESIHSFYTKINARDVTEEYVDITSRLATKKEVRDRYVEILRKRAQTVKDILEAEEKIRVIQEEIEAIEGRLRYLRNKTALSTINIEIFQEIPYVKPPKVTRESFFTKLLDGFLDGWELIQEITLGLTRIWPLLLLIALLFSYRGRIRAWFKR